jgi:SAM-dependent methyltransferase
MASQANPASVITNSRYGRRGIPDGLPLPPPGLRFLSAGTTDISWFLRGGALGAASIADALSARNVAIENLGTMLDFGCGCGRVLRCWQRLDRTRICGTDHNPKAAAWCRQNLPFVHIQVNRLSPPLDYSDEEFGLVYALSVFTHLTEELQVPWMSELARVVKPGGYLVVSTHGEAYSHRLNDLERRRFAAGRLVVKNDTSAPGTNYCAAYHPHAYVRDHLVGDLELVDFIPEGAKGNPVQDLYVLHRPVG